ncbi:hypothetical protein FQN54_009599 [Arachnomyces sp. PD_36]|nr:hypothetical protein FQN54_009599 [Arachnomyces sp. PD_36]
MATPQSRPYRRILTSALHRRFVHASALALLVCYVVAFFIGVKSSLLWSWLPFGPCGIRALLLFMSSLAVFILRVGQMHVGARATKSSYHTFRSSLFPLHIIQTFGWYFFSAWWFSEVYVWSSSEEAELGWVKPGRSYERAQLNERPIYLHSYYLLLAALQAVTHLYFDDDQVPVPVTRKSAKSKDQTTHRVEPLIRVLQKSLPRIVINSAIRSAAIGVAGPFVYMLVLRGFAYSWTLSFAKLFWNFPRSAAEPPGYIPPLHVFLLIRSVTSGTLLMVLWQTSNLFYSSFLAQEPLKKGQPLTTETKDPNGSLLNGLKAKKEVVKTFAFWELCYISQRFPDRRKAIFNDIDREGGATWTQILNASTNVIQGISTRIQEYQNPTTSAEAEKAKASTESSKSAPIQTLPRLTPAPSGENIFLNPPKPGANDKFGAGFGSVARSYGQSADWTPAARATAREMIDRASTAVLSPERKKRITSSAQDLKLLTDSSASAAGSDASAKTAHPLIVKFFRSPLGRPFSQPFARRLRSIVLGSPHSSLSSIVDSIESLTRLLVASLAEDQFGKVQADVPTVVRLFTVTITTLQDFVDSGLDLNWVDVDIIPAQSTDPEQEERRKQARKVEEVEIVLDALRGGLSELLAAFKLYLGQVGLAGKDLRLAREAAGIEDESSE